MNKLLFALLILSCAPLFGMDDLAKKLELITLVVTLSPADQSDLEVTFSNQFTRDAYALEAPDSKEGHFFKRYWTPSLSRKPNHYESHVRVYGPQRKKWYDGMVQIKHAQPEDDLEIHIDTTGECVTVKAIGDSTPDGE